MSKKTQKNIFKIFINDIIYVYYISTGNELPSQEIHALLIIIFAYALLFVTVYLQSPAYSRYLVKLQNLILPLLSLDPTKIQIFGHILQSKTEIQTANLCPICRNHLQNFKFCPKFIAIFFQIRPKFCLKCTKVLRFL